jgi:hypothetical protein
MNALSRVINTILDLPRSSVRGPVRRFEVVFLNHDFSPTKIIKFQTDTPDDTSDVVAAISAFYSGDDCTCMINGELAQLERDWGLSIDAKQNLVRSYG